MMCSLNGGYLRDREIFSLSAHCRHPKAKLAYPSRKMLCVHCRVNFSRPALRNHDQRMFSATVLNLHDGDSKASQSYHCHRSYNSHRPLERMFKVESLGKTCFTFTVETYGTYSTLFAVYGGRKLLHFRTYQLNSIVFKYLKISILRKERNNYVKRSFFTLLQINYLGVDQFPTWFTLFCGLDFYQRFCSRDLHEQHFVALLQKHEQRDYI
ncbi:hypothetical protein T4A_12141 [Trichinella pseudospiralis]|uniref:Uncharacterized protein n=1 Tax=Trichinella pseudospiralis TaxID=6337 RepID=A0A0V1EQC1_TRIPS|nr:hypothetical protein T4A_12141 [Trichinella pseudospiralis]KRY89978.1 hypothetical protein T4D_2188 [Trichinella pseudospiralis]